MLYSDRNNIETLVSEQLIKDAQPFIEFLKEYYKFLNQDNQPDKIIDELISNTDLDHVVDQFIQYIYKEVGFGMAAKLAANKINLYKHIDEFYKAKGSSDAFRLLFRLLFNKEIEIELPKESILIASDGKWIQQTIIFIDVVYGNSNVFNSVNEYVLLTNSDGTKVEIEIERVRFIKDNIYELTIAKGYNGIIKENATVGNSSFNGTLINSLANFEILQAGKNFRVGQVLELSDGINDSTKSLIKVTRVNGEGGVLSFEFIKFGLDYSGEFISYLSPINYDLDFSSNPSDYGFTEDLLGRVFDNVNTKEYLKIEVNPFSVDYFLGDYTDDSAVYGENNIYGTESSTTNDLNYGVIGDDDILNYESFPNKAVVKFTQAPVARYGGSYSTNNGFLSDSIVLQDNDYYQAYSYVIKSDERFSDYEDSVRKTVHPSGFALFGQYQIVNQFDISTRIELLVKLFTDRFVDVVDTTEAVAKLVIKPVEDEIITSTFTHWELTKPLFSSVTLDEAISKIFTNKPQFDNIITSSNITNIAILKQEFDIVITNHSLTFFVEKTLSDSIGALDSDIAELPNVYATGYFGQEYSEGLEEVGVEKTYYKVVEGDSITVTDLDYGIRYDGGEGIVNVLTASDSQSGQVNKNLEEFPNTSDSIQNISTDKSLENSINTSETGTLDLNDYSLHYFSEPYVEKIYTFN